MTEVDVIHIHGWGFEGGRVAAKQAARTKTPYVLSPHGTLCGGPHNAPSLWKRWWSALTEAGCVRGARYLLAMNDAEAKQLGKDAKHRNVRVRPYGLSFGEYGDVRAGSSHLRQLLVLGSLHPRGGCVALLKALAELGPIANGWSVVFAAADVNEWRPMLEAAVRRKGGADRVQFVEALDLDSQRRLLSESSVVVAPNLHWDLGVSILQAAACGIPAIATTAAVPFGLDGAVRSCEPRRDELREALRSVLSISREDRTRLGANLKETARKTLDWSALIPCYVELYHEATRT